MGFAKWILHFGGGGGLEKNGLEFETVTKKWEENDDNVRGLYDFKIGRRERERYSVGLKQFGNF